MGNTQLDMCNQSIIYIFISCLKGVVFISYIMRFENTPGTTVVKCMQ